MDCTITPDIVIFTNGNLFSRIILGRFMNKYKSRIAIVVIVTGDYYGNRGIRALIEFSRLTSWIYVFYKIWTIMIIKLLEIGDKKSIASVEKLCGSLGIPNFFVSDINEPPLFEKIKELSPQYLVSVSCPQLIRKKWLNLVRGKGINIHSSLLPKYGGLAPYFWVLVNDEKITGTTVHFLIKGFDKGNILSQTIIPIKKGMSCFNLFLNLCIEGQLILVEAFNKMENGDQGSQQNLTGFTYYSHPTTSSYFNLKRKGFSLFNFKDLNLIKNYLRNLTINNLASK